MPTSLRRHTFHCLAVRQPISGSSLFLSAGHAHQLADRHWLIPLSGIGGFCDWAVSIKGLGPEWLLRVALALVDTLGYMGAARFRLLELRPLIGSDKERRVTRAFRHQFGAISCSVGHPVVCRIIVTPSARCLPSAKLSLMQLRTLYEDPVPRNSPQPGCTVPKARKRKAG